MILTDKIKSLLVIFIIVVFSSCHEIGHKGIDEGIMKYEITYLDNKANNPLISLLPEQLDMYFKDNSVCLVVKGWMGIFESKFIKQSKTCKTISTLKIMNKRYYYETDSTSSFMGSSGYQNLIIEFDDLKKDILNYSCSHAKVTVPKTDIIFDIYYTKEISIDNPNKNTLFKDISGVLMEFQIEMNGIPMHLIASEIVNIKIEDQAFDVPEGFSLVEKEEVDTIFSSLIK